MPYVTQCFEGRAGRHRRGVRLPEGAARLDRSLVPRRIRSLGTDGFGRSEDRATLRDFFEVDARFVALATLAELAAGRTARSQAVAQAIKDFGIDAEKANPATS